MMEMDFLTRELDISNKGLTELPADIEKYLILEKLICHNNKFRSLDRLQGLKHLTYLDCDNNPYITSLDKLPSSLEELQCRS
jgi:Leucine-rich repeat (LRR) protein